CHTFEQRLWKLLPVVIGPYSILMPMAMVFSGCTLEGNNVIHPCTLIMKNDHLPINTQWHGCPATMTLHTAE
ncbi:unnamed protein product, partial [Didymodactylos carnosus]